MIDTVENLDQLNDNLIEQMDLNNQLLQQQFDLQNEKIDLQNQQIAELKEVIENQELIIPDDTIFNFDSTDIVNHLEQLQNLNVGFFNDVVDLVIFFIAVVLGAIAVKAFVEGATKW